MSSAEFALPTPEQVAKYEPVIGLEVHCQLATNTKIFCGCPTSFGEEPNSNTCPVCLGLPGALPVLSRQAVELAVQGSLALRCNARTGVVPTFLTTPTVSPPFSKLGPPKLWSFRSRLGPL